MRNTQNITTQTLTVKEASKLLGISPWSIYKLIHAKRLPTVKAIGPIRIPKARLLKITGLNSDDDENNG